MIVDSVCVPQVVQEAIYHWKEWLNGLPPAGPTPETTCGSIEKLYALHIVKRLHAQYHPPEVKPNYDWRAGEAMNGHIDKLDDLPRKLFRDIHFRNFPLDKAAKRSGITLEHAVRQLEITYNRLAGALCVK